MTACRSSLLLIAGLLGLAAVVVYDAKAGPRCQPGTHSIVFGSVLVVSGCRR